LHPAVIHPSHVTIPRLESGPRLDDFLTGTARSQAAKQMLRISDFIDRYPKDGRPVTEPTVAYLGYTREYVFAAFVCKDKTPRLIRAHMLARDSMGDDDFVEVILKTKVQHRLLGFYWPAKTRFSFTFVLPCTHNGKKYDPRDAFDTARKRIQELKNDSTWMRRCVRPE